MKKSIKYMLLISVCFVSILSGCSRNNEDQNADLILGEKSNGEKVYEVLLNNDTGKDIKKLSIKTSTMNDFGKNMISSNEVFDNGEEGLLYYDATNAIKENEEEQKESRMQTSPEYTILLVFEDDTSLQLHSFPFEDVEEATIKLDENNEIVYLEYVSLNQDNQVSTYEAEKKIRDDQVAAEQAAAEQAAAEQAAAEQAAAEQAAAEQAAAEQAANQNVYQSQPSYVQEQPQYVETTPPANDGCLGDSVETW